MSDFIIRDLKHAHCNFYHVQPFKFIGVPIGRMRMKTFKVSKFSPLTYTKIEKSIFPTATKIIKINLPLQCLEFAIKFTKIEILQPSEKNFICIRLFCLCKERCIKALGKLLPFILPSLPKRKDFKKKNQLHLFRQPTTTVSHAAESSRDFGLRGRCYSAGFP